MISTFCKTITAIICQCCFFTIHFRQFSVFCVHSTSWKVSPLGGKNGRQSSTLQGANFSTRWKNTKYKQLDIVSHHEDYRRIQSNGYRLQYIFHQILVDYNETNICTEYLVFSAQIAGEAKEARHRIGTFRMGVRATRINLWRGSSCLLFTQLEEIQLRWFGLAPFK